MIMVNEPLLDGNEKNYLQKCIDSGWISSEGPFVRDFEEKFAQLVGRRHAISVTNGSSALETAITALDLQKGDEVILPAQTFVASGLSILMTGAKPVFADIQYQTGNIDPNSIKTKITEKTKAIMPVHWAGYPCDMNEINQIAEENDLTVIEDAAHALGATYKGKPIGSISDFTAFSFQAIKHLTTGDGGALCCIDENHYQEARNRRWFGIDRKYSKPSILGERVFDIEKVGFKYHMNDLAAAVGLGNLEEFPERLNKTHEITSIYRIELAHVPGLQLLNYKDDRESAYWLFTILVDIRLDFINKMKASEIPVSVVDQRIDRNSVFGGITPDLVNQERFDLNQIAIPIHSALTENNILKVIQTIKSGW